MRGTGTYLGEAQGRTVGGTEGEGYYNIPGRGTIPRSYYGRYSGRGAPLQTWEGVASQFLTVGGSVGEESDHLVQWLPQ